MVYIILLLVVVLVGAYAYWKKFRGAPDKIVKAIKSLYEPVDDGGGPKQPPAPPGP